MDNENIMICKDDERKIAHEVAESFYTSLSNRTWAVKLEVVRRLKDMSLESLAALSAQISTSIDAAKEDLNNVSEAAAGL